MPEGVEWTQPTRRQRPRQSKLRDNLLLDFGDTFLVDSYIRDLGFNKALNALGYSNPDTLWALLHFYLLSTLPNEHAEAWLEGNVARVLYPQADLSAQSVDIVLSFLGRDSVWGKFFQAYSALLQGTFGSSAKAENVLIDSTGLPDSSHFRLTSIEPNQQKDDCSALRLLYAVQLQTGLPLALPYVHPVYSDGSDAAMVMDTIYALEEQGVNITAVHLLNGYYGPKDITVLYQSRVAFLLRLPKHCKLYKQLVEKHASTLISTGVFVDARPQLCMIKRVPCKLEGLDKQYSAYAYLVQDQARKLDGNAAVLRLTRSYDSDNYKSELFADLNEAGLTVLVSSKQLEPKELLALYDTRRYMDAVFALQENAYSFDPKGSRSEAMVRGHLLLTFMAAVVTSKLQALSAQLEGTTDSMLQHLRNHKCMVSGEEIALAKMPASVAQIYEAAQIKCPSVLTQSSWLEQHSCK